MKTIKQYREQRSTNCGGTNEWFDIEDKLVEETDVGIQYDHYLGFRHRRYTFKKSDVGKTISRVSQPGYMMWSFCK